MDKIKVSPSAQEVFAKWIARGDLIGVFENADFGHPDLGRQVFVPVHPPEREKFIPHKTCLPDSPKIGLGWRYLFKSAHNTLDDFVFEEEPPPEPKKRTRRRNRG